LQNPKITEIENKFKDKIIKVLGFENLVNVIIISLDEIEKKLGEDKAGTYYLYEHKTSSTVRFVLYNALYKSMIISTGDMPIQVPDQQKTPTRATAH
jgi:hypothetical protein